MSICSTHSSTPAPESTVSENGYRLTTTRSNGAMPSFVERGDMFGLARVGEQPGMHIGCKVLTRPSSISGKAGDLLDRG